MNAMATDRLMGHIVNQSCSVAKQNVSHQDRVSNVETKARIELNCKIADEPIGGYSQSPMIHFAISCMLITC